jgi:hypothetical protein
MGNNRQAVAVYEQAIAETERLIELEPIVSSHKWNLVVAAMNSGGPDLALGNPESVVARWRAAMPQLDGLLHDEPDNQRYRQVKAMLQSNIAMVLRDSGKLEEAVEPLMSATAILQQQALQLDKAAESYLPVALNHFELAKTYVQLQRWEDALRSLEASDKIALEILETQPDFTPAQGHLLDSLLVRYQTLKQSGAAAEELVAAAKESVDLGRILCSESPDVAEHHVALTRALLNSADALLLAGAGDAALPQTREAFAAAERAEADSDAANRGLRRQAKSLEVRVLTHLLDDNNDAALSKQLETARAALQQLEDERS